MSEAPHPSRGLVDTSVLIDLDLVDAEQLPNELAISALTIAELAASPHAAGDAGERAQGQITYSEPRPRRPATFDAGSARADGRIYAQPCDMVAGHVGV
jgi:predicted nucleic acid-binding protein